METIDRQVEKVIESEKKRLDDFNDLNMLLDSLKDLPIDMEKEMRIPQKDTIGKSIYFNVPRY